jgi:hypothetical protein
MYYSDLSIAGADDLAQARLSREFPDVPARIIAAVLTAYRRVTPSLPEAAQAAHDRIADARAM